MLGQVMRTQCAECKQTMGCYVEKRAKQKMYCMTCDGMVCPVPNSNPSHGLCANCTTNKPLLSDEQLIEMEAGNDNIFVPVLLSKLSAETSTTN
jgi:hypothetical protein